MLRRIILALVVASAGALRVVPNRVPATTSRRAAVGQAVAAAAALAAGSPLPAFAAAAPDAKASATVRETAAKLKALVKDKEAFVNGIIDGDASAPQLPAAVPFATFQKLEGTSDVEFMEAAIDYAEAFRNAKDLVKLAKLTTQQVEISVKEKGKPRETKVMSYADAPGSSLDSTANYAERAANEVLGASLAIDAAVKAMK